MATGQCPTCNTPNEYTETVCNMCGHRLPWAQKQSQPLAPVAPQQVPPAYPPQAHIHFTPAPAPRNAFATFFGGGLGGGVGLGLGCCLGPFLLVSLIGVLASIGSNAQRNASVNPRPPSSASTVQPNAPVPPGPSFTEADSKMDDRLTTWTEAQKQAYWSSIRGTQVTWTGQLQSADATGTGTISMKCNPNTFASDVEVTLDGTQLDRLASLNKDQQVTVQGILDGHGMSGYTISRGRVMGL